MKFLAGLVVGVVLAVLAPLAWLAGGKLDVSAAAETGALEQRLAPWVVERSIAAHAPAARNPHADDPESLARGRAHYRAMCVACHGAPGVEIGEIGRGLNPVPPSLDVPAVQRRSDGELFWIVKRGIRMSGMPAFGGTHDDAELWALVSFVRRLPRLADEDRRMLR